MNNTKSIEYLQKEYPVGTVFYYKNFCGARRKGVVTAIRQGVNYPILEAKVEVPGHNPVIKTMNPAWIVEVVERPEYE